VTSAFGGQRSIQLSYGCLAAPTLDQTPQIKQRRSQEAGKRKSNAGRAFEIGTLDRRVKPGEDEGRPPSAFRFLFMRPAWAKLDPARLPVPAPEPEPEFEVSPPRLVAAE
jgi:hypothetical protein